MIQMKVAAIYTQHRGIGMVPSEGLLHGVDEYQPVSCLLPILFSHIRILYAGVTIDEHLVIIHRGVLGKHIPTVYAGLISHFFGFLGFPQFHVAAGQQ